MNENKLTIKDSSLAFFAGFIICQIMIVAVSVIGLIIVKSINIDISQFELFFNTGIGYFILTLVLNATLLVMFFFFNKGKNNTITTKVKLNKILLYLAIAIISFVLLYPIVITFDSLLVKLGITPNTIPYELNTQNYIISIFSLVILPAICEELLFRGIIFKGLKKYGKILSITITGIMFALFHMSISQTIYPLLMGIMLSVIMYYENNIYYCILVHMVNNFISLTLSFLNISLVFNHWTYILLAIFLLIVFISTVGYFIFKNHKKAEKQPMTNNDKIYLIGSLGIMLLLWIIALF